MGGMMSLAVILCVSKSLQVCFSATRDSQRMDSNNTNFIIVFVFLVRGSLGSMNDKTLNVI